MNAVRPVSAEAADAALSPAEVGRLQQLHVLIDEALLEPSVAIEDVESFVREAMRAPSR